MRTREIIIIGDEFLKSAREAMLLYWGESGVHDQGDLSYIDNGRCEVVYYRDGKQCSIA